MRTGRNVYIVFIDLKLAYDTVPHGRLFAKLVKEKVIRTS